MKSELMKGIKVEKEHNRTVDFIGRYVKKYNKMPPKDMIFKSIARDHLKEDKKYYSKLKSLKL